MKNELERLLYLRNNVMSELEHLVFLTDKIREEEELKSANLYGEISYKIAKKAREHNENIGYILEHIEKIQ